MMPGSPRGILFSLLSRVLSGMRDFVLSRFGSMAIGLVLALLLVWFAGPWVGLKSASARLIVIGILVAIFLVALGVRWWLARRRGRELAKDLEESAMLGTRPDRETEIASLRKQMHDAIGALKSSELGTARTGTAALYALPWYMVIGPSAVGKSTILRNSGLNFPYSKHDPRGIQGLGGTRNCDWWFSDQAIFLDTAGRYTTEEEDRDEWFAFLDMLRRHRSRQPINGVIVAISIADLLTSDSEGISAHAKVVRDRIDELVGRLGILFPVYIIFTKCDLIKGFSAYFDDLSDQERDQVWGASMLALEADDKREPGDIFEEEFDALHARLCAHRLLKLSLERNVERKAEIVDLPNQYQTAGPRLAEFIQQVFKQNPYKETPSLSGFFFTSGAQEGTPIQRVIGSLMEAFGAAAGEVPHHAPGAEPKAYFIHNLLREVILPNSRQVMRNRRMDKRARWLKRATVVATILIMIGGVMLFSASYARKTLLIADVKDSSGELVRALSARRPDLGSVLKAMLVYYNDSGELWADSEKKVTLYRPGGFEEPLAQSFLAGMETLFLLPVADLLEERMRKYVYDAGERSARFEQFRGDESEIDQNARSNSRRTAEAYEALKLYLYLTSPDIVKPTEVLDAFGHVWVAALRQNGVRVEEVDTDRLKFMVEYYLQHMRLPAGQPLHARAWTADKGLIATVRTSINRVPSAERLYADLRDLGARQLDSVDLVSLLDGQPRGAMVSRHVIPGIYSRKGWEEVVWPYLQSATDSSLRSDWVLGTKDEIDEVPAEQVRAQLARQIRQMYFADYAEQWFELLGSISARKFDTLHDASTQLQSFAKDGGAVTVLIKSIHRNVAIPDPAKKSLLAIGADKDRGMSADGGPIVEELRVPFKYLIRMTQQATSGKENNWLSQYQNALVAIQKDMSRLASSSDVQRDTRMFAAKLMNGDSDSELYRSWLTINQILEDVDTRTAQALQSLLRAPIRNVWGSIVTVAQKDLERTWKNKTLFVFNESLRGRYPFAKDGRDAALNDVMEFFRPGAGTFWAFVNDDLKPFIERKGNTWEARKWLGVGPDFNPEFLRAINRTALISESLFKRGDQTPNLSFGVYPYPNSRLSESTLTVDGTDYRYRNGPQEWHTFAWPGQNPGARVRAVRAGTLTTGELAADGVWAWLRLLDRAHIGSDQGGSFVATWSVPDSVGDRVSVSFRIRPDRNNNPFRQSVLQGYYPPADMFPRTDIADNAGNRNPG